MRTSLAVVGKAGLGKQDWDGGDFPQFTTVPIVSGEIGIRRSDASTLGLAVVGKKKERRVIESKCRRLSLG